MRDDGMIIITCRPTTDPWKGKQVPSPSWKTLAFFEWNWRGILPFHYWENSVW